MLNINELKSLSIQLEALAIKCNDEVVKECLYQVAENLDKRLK